MATFHINGLDPFDQGITGLKLTYGNMVPDTLEFTCETSAWDADPIYAYGTTITLTRDGVKVFVGKVRITPRFLGAKAETTTYIVTGPWDWLQRRALLQNQAVVTDPESSTVPTLVPQGLAILCQDDGGASVDIATALTVVIMQGITAGVPITLGLITGFGYATNWDEVSDLTLADAILRLLGSAPDAVVWFDYATAPHPTMHIGRRANLAAVSLAIPPPGQGGLPAYAPFETVSITARPDLLVPGVFLTFRRINTVNGVGYLQLETRTAGAGSPTDENALVRTVQLAGSSFSETVLTQEVKTLPLAGALGNGTLDATVITPSSDPDTFNELAKFWVRKIPALGADDVVLKGFKNRLRKAAPVADSSGAETTPTLDTSLVRELIEGAITPWMRSSGLNRKAQEQNYEVRIAYTVAGVDQKDADGYGITYSAGVMATNASTRIGPNAYSFQESSDSTDPEPTPEGLAASLYDALSTLQHEGSFVLVEQECTLTVRPGVVVNLAGGRAEWATMKAVVQEARADLDQGRTEERLGFPHQLGPAELVEILRANRLKRPAERGLQRTTGSG